MDNSQRKKQAIQEALASARIEGLPVTPEVEANIRRILDGEMTVEDRIQQIRKENHQEGKEMHDGNSQI